MEIGVVILVGALGYWSLGLTLERPPDSLANATPIRSPTSTIAGAVTFTPRPVTPTSATLTPVDPGEAIEVSPPTVVKTPRAATATRAAAVTVTPAIAATPITYTVQEGDTMEAISEQFGVSTEAIAHASNLSDPDRLTIGQKLIIPPK